MLKDAGMVEIARLEEAGGGTRKDYKSHTRVFSYELPEGAEERLAGASEQLRDDLYAAIADLLAAHGDELEAVAREMKPCEYCKTQHYEEFIIRELLTRTLTDLSEDGDLDALLD